MGQCYGKSSSKFEELCNVATHMFRCVLNVTKQIVAMPHTSHSINIVVRMIIIAKMKKLEGLALGLS